MSFFKTGLFKWKSMSCSESSGSLASKPADRHLVTWNGWTNEKTCVCRWWFHFETCQV